MIASIGGPQSELEAEAKKKLITEKEIKEVLSSETPPKDLRRAKARMRELLDFYDRIIRSIDATVRTVKANATLTHEQKQDTILIRHAKELSQAKAEKAKFRRYFKQIELKLGENEVSSSIQ